MLGAIIGDIIGSRFEFKNHRSKNFDLIHNDCFFTDDTVCTVAVADWIIKSTTYGITSSSRFAPILQKWCSKYPEMSYGLSFAKWIKNPIPYNSYGNGAAMRISPVGLYFKGEDVVLKYSDMVTEVSHNHPEGMKGARAVALAIYLAKNGKSKAEIKNRIETDYNYKLDFTCDSIRKINWFDETCQVTVPQSLVCFIESNDFVDAIRLAVSIGGDTDTIAAITGSIAEAFYKEISQELIDFALTTLSDDLVKVVLDYYEMIDVEYAKSWFDEVIITKKESEELKGMAKI